MATVTAESKKKRSQMTSEELLKDLAERKAKALQRYDERAESIKDQARFGGRAAIAQQKLLLGVYMWKLAQTDAEVKKAAKSLIAKMPEAERSKMDAFLKVIGEGTPVK